MNPAATQALTGTSTGVGPADSALATDTDRVGQQVTERLGAWASRLQLADIPNQVLAHAKLCMLDALGCGLYGSRQRWGLIAADVAESFGGNGAALYGRPGRASAADAAMANGTSIHGFEIDDVHVSSSFHPGSVTIPATLACAEHLGRSGEDVLAAVVAGYETGIRVGICAGLSHSTSGYHVTGTVGGIAAAAACARAMGLDPNATMHAIAIGATQASGLYAARMGAMAKRFHAGRASQSGVVAAYLAQRGFTGSTVAIEAPFGGFMSTLHGQFEPATILDRLGEHWETARTGFKVYAACASAHTTVDALDELMKQGLTAQSLKKLTIGLSKKGFTNIGWPYVPKEIVSAQMNGYYTAAVKLLDGQAFVDQYRQERIADPAILALIERIEIVHNPELDIGGAPKRHTVEMQAQLTDGRQLHSRIEHRLGSAERPLDPGVVVAKFRQLAATVLSPASIERTIAFIGDIENQKDLGGLLKIISTS
jgi:aconitate decarboxylase